jgi:histone-binding protein RBBP4
MSGENDFQEEKNPDEQYENWKQNIPFMYEICISHQNPWPSLTV